MFENKTFENILSEMLSYVESQNPELDLRTGSIIYTALAPVALELETAYHEMDMILEETFVETASKEYLVKHGDQMGVELNLATCAHLEGWFNVEIEIGSRFSYDKFNYTVISKISDPVTEGDSYKFELVCETAGSEPNERYGSLIPITYVNDLGYAELKSMITYGEDEEDTETYRYRIQAHAKNPSIDGNLAQYQEWLDEYDGIGKYKITPCWNGINTIKLTVLSTENTPLNETKLNEIQTHFDPATLSAIDQHLDDTTLDGYPHGRGMGNGVAPIGAIVTVDTIYPAQVEVDAQVLFEDDAKTDLILEKVRTNISEYLNSIIFNKSKVEYLPIYAAIYGVDGISEVEALQVSITHYEDGSIEVMDIAQSSVLYVDLCDNEYAALTTIRIE